MKFQEFEYKRPDLEALLQEIEQLKQRLQNAPSYSAFLAAFKDYDSHLKSLNTMANLCYIRHTINTADPFYKEEREWFNENSPIISNAQVELVNVILKSPWRQALEDDVPKTWFLRNEFDLKTISSKIIEEMQEENRLESEYQKLIASAQIPFHGKNYTLAALEEPMNDPDRSIRKEAHQAYWNWFDEHEDQIGRIYHDLVQVRTKMAQKMGYENYIPFGYLRMARMDYDQHDVEVYRRNVLKDVVPVCLDLYTKQAQTHGYDGYQLPAWDEKVEFEGGNPTPKCDPDEIVQRALMMFQELSPETKEFFQMMVDQDLLDLVAKPHKAAGGYCTSIEEYGVPFIFANFSHTQHDIETLTHESGHGFQAWCSRNIFPSECIWATMESAEITSMAMEFFTWPWMQYFFEEDADRYRQSHLGGAIKFIPYGVLVDHFQHEVYANPHWTPEQRMECWRRLEKQYLPQKDYQDIDFLERGGWWMRQLHIFLDPFYYIDYTLAQVAALQFWSRMQHEDPKAFEDYQALCQAGGTKPFKELIALGHLKVPFEEGCLHETMQDVENWFEKQEAKEKSAL